VTSSIECSWHGADSSHRPACYGSVAEGSSLLCLPRTRYGRILPRELRGLVSSALGYGQSIAAIVVATLVGSVIVGLLAGRWGTRTGMAQMALARLRPTAPRASCAAGSPQLDSAYRLGWNQLRLRRRPHLILTGACVRDLAALHRRCQGALGILGYEAIHTLEKSWPIRPRPRFIVLTHLIAARASNGLSPGPMRWRLADQDRSFILYSTTIIASFVLAGRSIYASDYTATARRTPRARACSGGPCSG